MRIHSPKSVHGLSASALSLALLVVLLATGCSVGPAGSPEEIVEKAIEAQGNLKSVRMEMDVMVKLEGGPNQSGMTSSYRGDGYYEQPDKSSITITSSSGETEVITIGDKAYVLAPGSRTWVEKNVESVSEGTSPTDVTDYLKYTEELRLADQRGDTYHLEFYLDMGRYTKVVDIQGVDPTAFKGKRAYMDVWVLKDSFYVDRATLDFAGNVAGIGAGELSVSMEVEFSEFNEPVSIEAPVTG